MANQETDEKISPQKLLPLCGRRMKNCRKCGHKYSKEEKGLWNCPECGEDRKCTRPSYDNEPGRPCYFHGGPTPRGIESPNFTHGHYSRFARFLPKRFEDIMNEIGDPLDLTDVTRVMLARFWDVVSRTHRGESEELMKKALEYCDELDEAQVKAAEYGRLKAAAIQANDPAGAASAQAQIENWSQKAGQAWNNIKATLKQAVSDWKTWDNAIDIGTKVTRVAESQRKRLVEEKLMMGIDAVQKLYFAMAEAINRNCQSCPHCQKDLAANRKNIQEDFKSIALHGLGGPGMLGPGKEEEFESLPEN